MGSCLSSIYVEQKISQQKVKFFIPNLSRVKVISVYDGDTITVAGYYNMDVYKFKVRINGIDTPEMRTHDLNEKEIALISRDVLCSKIDNKWIMLENISYDKYGRILADVYLNQENISDYLIEKRLAVKYDGGTKVSPKDWKEYYRTGKMDT